MYVCVRVSIHKCKFHGFHGKAWIKGIGAMRGSSHCFSLQCFVRGTVSLDMHLITTFIRKVTVSAVETKSSLPNSQLTTKIHMSNKFAILKTTILIGFFLHVQD